MRKQTHRIRRQVVELIVPREEDAAPLYARVSRLHHARIVPVLDDVCGELCDPDSVQRIARMELDLGRLDVTQLEEAFPARLRDELRRALQSELDHAPAHVSDQALRAVTRGQVDESTSGGAAGGTLAQSQLELFALFVRTGILPWWADVSRPDIVDHALHSLLSSSPAALARFLRAIADERRALLRIAGAFDDGLLAELGACLVPSISPRLVQSLARRLTNLVPPARPAARRRTAWLSVLHATALRAGELREPEAACEDVLMSFALVTKRTYASVVSEFHAAASGGAGSDAEVLRLADALDKVGHGGEAGGVEANRQQIIRSLTQLGRSAWMPSGLCSELLAVVDQLPPALRKGWLAMLDAAVRGANVGHASDVRSGLREILQSTVPHRLLPDEMLARRLVELEVDQGDEPQVDDTAGEGAASEGHEAAAEIARLADVLDKALLGEEPADVEARREQIVHLLAQLDRSRGTPSGVCADLSAVVDRLPLALCGTWPAILKALVRAANAARASDVRRGLHELLQSTAPHRLLPARELAHELEELEAAEEEDDDEPLDVTFSESDEVYVENAGLIVLWPFLTRFFEYRGLLEDERFKEAASAHRAVGLMQYLAAEDPEPPEFALALNKLLCGLAIEEVFDFGAPLSEEEIEACDDLLRAVIENAPILKNMSLDGFRGSFLLRRGVLSASGGAWLLRVERETFDVVLDRLPWTLAWIKLPWMDATLRVEW